MNLCAGLLRHVLFIYCLAWLVVHALDWMNAAFCHVKRYHLIKTFRLEFHWERNYANANISAANNCSNDSAKALQVCFSNTEKGDHLVVARHLRRGSNY